MPRNGSGTFTRPVADYVPNTAISSTSVNSEMDGIATGLTNSLAKDGQTTPTANLPMATYKHTGVGNASARTDYAAAGQVQDGSFIWCGTAGGTADALTLTPSPAITAYAAGQTFRFISAADNTGATTIAVNGLAAKAVQLKGATLAAADIATGLLYTVTYDGTQFQLGGDVPFGVGWAEDDSGNVTAGGTLDMDGNNLTVDFTTVEAAGEHAEENDANATGTVTIQATDKTVLRRTLTGDVTLHVAGAPTPGKGWSTELRTTQDGTGGRDLTILPANLLSYSEQFDNAYWTKNSSTISANAAAGPDGRTTMDKIVEASATDIHGVLKTLTKAAAATTYVFSVDFKADERTWAFVWIYGTSSGNRAAAHVNLSTGVASSVASVGNFSDTSATVEDLGGGIYRLNLTTTTDASTGLTVLLGASTGAGTVSYAGDGSSGVLIGRVQITEGATVLGYSRVDATRAGMVIWRAGSGNAIDYTAQAAATESRIILGIGSDGEIMVDDVSVEA